MKKTTTSQKAKRILKQPYWRYGLVLAVAVLVAAAWLAWGGHTYPVPANGPLSRQVIDYQESIIEEVKPPPTLAGLQYAYVASAYADGLTAGGQAGGLAAASSVLSMLYPAKQADIPSHIQQLALQNHVKMHTNNSAAVAAIIGHYHSRYANDGHTLAWDGVIPKGQGKWIKVTVKDPLTPRAGDWQRWNVTTSISVPPPPVYGSAEDLRQIDIVKQAVATRNGQDINTINFWGGTPGTATPGGIWQNQLFATVQKDLPRNAVTADQKYAVVQKTVAQAISDAFMECWKAKFTYWTARPSMRIPGLVTAMDDPVFPSYISGHSTISKAAADVLTIQVPKYQTQWEAMAMEARQSRLKAGIHFDVDNVVGFQVGTEVAQQTASALQLKQVLN